jgi:hypothetical protein
MLKKVEATTVKAAENEPFIIVEQFDIKVLRYQIPGWEDLSKSRN